MENKGEKCRLYKRGGGCLKRVNRVRNKSGGGRREMIMIMIITIMMIYVSVCRDRIYTIING